LRSIWTGSASGYDDHREELPNPDGVVTDLGYWDTRMRLLTADDVD
jgi:hypothetical protein